MKKALVVLLALAVVGGAFAADLSGVAIGNVIPVQGSTEKDSDITAGGGMGVIRIQGAGENENGTFGGWVRMNAASQGGGVSGYALAWWKPIEQFKFQIGGNPDGFIAVNEITGWGFYADAGDAGVVEAGNAWGWGSYYGYNKNAFGTGIAGVKFNDAIYGGTPVDGALLTITPMEALAINIAIPFIAVAGKTAEEVYKKTHAQVAYTIDSIGRIAVTYAGGTMGKLDGKAQALWTMDADPETVGNQDTVRNDYGSTIYGSFLLTAVENLTVNIGAGFKTPVDNSYGKRNGTLSVAVGADFSAGAFGIKARAMGQFMGSETLTGSSEVKDPTYVIADIMPSFAIDDTLKANLSVGLGVTLPNSGDAVVGWHANPYISKAVTGGGLFFAGVKVYSDGIKVADKTTINWGIPMGMVYSW